LYINKNEIGWGLNLIWSSDCILKISSDSCFVSMKPCFFSLLQKMWIWMNQVELVPPSKKKKSWIGHTWIPLLLLLLLPQVKLNNLIWSYSNFASIHSCLFCRFIHHFFIKSRCYNFPWGNTINLTTNNQMDYSRCWILLGNVFAVLYDLIAS